MFTMLFPIRIVVSALSKFSAISRALFAPLCPFSARALSLILLQVENAVSLAEKNDEKTSRTTIIIIFGKLSVGI